MKTFFLLFGLLMINVASGYAQVAKSYTIMPGESYASSIPKSEIFEYPQFETGNVIFKDNTGSTVKLNYNRFFEEIVFIDPAGDTLALASPEKVKVVMIKNDEFFYATDHFVKLDTAIGDIKIATVSFFTESREKEVGYGKRVESSALSHNAYILPGSTKQVSQKLDLSPVEIITVFPKTIFVIGNKNNEFYIVTKKNLYTIFNKQEKSLKEYLSEKKPSFKSREELISLLKYMNSAID